jgi:hypothetical protein
VDHICLRSRIGTTLPDRNIVSTIDMSHRPFRCGPTPNQANPLPQFDTVMAMPGLVPVTPPA